MLRLLSYSFTANNKLGTVNIADLLSSASVNKDKIVHESECQVSDEQYIGFVVENATPKALSIGIVEKLPASDEELNEVHKATHSDHLEKVPN